MVLGDERLEDISARTGLALPEVWRALRRLSREGVVRSEAGRWSVAADLIAQRAREQAPPPQELDDDLPAEQAAVLRAFLSEGRLVRLPAARRKRLVVLDHVARVFEPGARYPEREVDALLRAFTDDHPALRRHLVDEGYLSREAGVYWRSGGTVDLEPG